MCIDSYKQTVVFKDYVIKGLSFKDEYLDQIPTNVCSFVRLCLNDAQVKYDYFVAGIVWLFKISHHFVYI